MIHLANIKSLINFRYGINNVLPAAVYLKVAYFNLHSGFIGYFLPLPIWNK